MLVKKIASWILVGLVLLFTVLALLAIWDVIDFEHVMRKLLSSIFVIFISSVVVLFIFSVVLNDKNNKQIPPKQ